VHRRKFFIIYPNQYIPGDGYKVRRSKLQALKCGIKMGKGSSVDVLIHVHAGSHKDWCRSISMPLWDELT